MSIWLVRAGKSGEYENKFLEENKIYLTWVGLKRKLTEPSSFEEMSELVSEVYPDVANKRIIGNWAGQFWSFANFEKGDWIVLPSKFRSTIHIGEITGNYTFSPKAKDPFFHSYDVKWLKKNIPRTSFDQDILYSLGAFLTICQISRNNAEQRIREMQKHNWSMKGMKHFVDSQNENEITEQERQSKIDLEEYSIDQIRQYIDSKFKGHEMARIIDAILEAKGYVVYRSPAGPDKGIDLLAAPEPLGFGYPRICVQVKTTNDPVDRPTLDQLIGTMQNVKADQGLLVSWNGFRSSVEKEIPSQFFNVRLWGQNDIIVELLKNYQNIDDEIKNEIPLKRIWTLSLTEDE